MTTLVCGWCGVPTVAAPACSRCGRDPRLAWQQRGLPAPVVHAAGAGRPALDGAAIRRRYRDAHDRLVGLGRDPTVEALAELLDRSPRTVRDWKRRYGV